SLPHERLLPSFHPSLTTFTHITYHTLNLFFLTYTAPTHIYTLSLHDALPICFGRLSANPSIHTTIWFVHPSKRAGSDADSCVDRSEEHTSELQSRENLVCRLLLEKKKRKRIKFKVPRPVQRAISIPSEDMDMR